MLKRLALYFAVPAAAIFAQQGAPKGGPPQRPPLFFKEEWKQTSAGGEHAVNPAEAVSDPNLELKLYGPTSKEFLLTGKAGDEGNPIHLWTGMCTSPCAASLKNKEAYADLSGLAHMRWVTKMSGFHQVRPIVKLADGTWLVGDHADGSTADWHDNEFSFSEVHWMHLNIDKVVTTGTMVNNPDLSKVDEIGFVDLMPSSGHGPGGWSDVGKIEVYAKAVKRDVKGQP